MLVWAVVRAALRGGGPAAGGAVFGGAVRGGAVHGGAGSGGASRSVAGDPSHTSRPHGCLWHHRIPRRTTSDQGTGMYINIICIVPMHIIQYTLEISLGIGKIGILDGVPFKLHSVIL